MNTVNHTIMTRTQKRILSEAENRGWEAGTYEAQGHRDEHLTNLHLRKEGVRLSVISDDRGRHDAVVEYAGCRPMVIRMRTAYEVLRING